MGVLFLYERRVIAHTGEENGLGRVAAKAKRRGQVLTKKEGEVMAAVYALCSEGVCLVSPDEMLKWIF